MNELNWEECYRKELITIIKEKNGNEYDRVTEELRKKYLSFNYLNEFNEYYLEGKKAIFLFTNLKPLNLYEIINIDDKIYFLYTNEEKSLIITDNIKDIIKFASKCLKVKFTNKKIKIYLMGFINSKIINLESFNIKYNFSVGNCLFDTEEQFNKYPKQINKIKKIFSIKNFKKIELDMNKFINNEEEFFVNNPVNLIITIDGNKLEFPIKMKKRVKKQNYNYLPFKSKKIGNHYIIARKTAKQNLVLVKREIEEIENTIKFNIYESTPFTFFFKILGDLYRIISPKKINLYYEKFASKAEEGTFELFKKARNNSKISKNYFIISDEEENKNFLKEKNVCAKFSFKYYFLLFASSTLITTEAQPHLNLLRTKNKYIKKSIYDKKYVFLQHGIIYLKSMGKNSTFKKGKEAYPDLFVVSSKKEAKVVNETLNIPYSRLIITGLAMFDKIKYNHINHNSKNKAIIMLTWKPYEEQLSDFTKSSYYENTLKAYDILCKYLKKEDIIIIPHPKVKDKMLLTPFGESVYSGLISEVLKEGKLLITDYSSICYNSFYQGAGVIFFQPDLELYELENGKLIPEDDEFIGYRCFDDKELEELIKKGIKECNIDLNYYRKKEFVEIYKQINEFYDGKNTERILKELSRYKII